MRDTTRRHLFLIFRITFVVIVYYWAIKSTKGDKATKGVLVEHRAIKDYGINDKSSSLTLVKNIPKVFR